METNNAHYSKHVLDVPKSRKSMLRELACSPVADSIVRPARGTYTEPVFDPSSVKFPKRIAVVNRGEAAVRLIRAVRELNAEGRVLPAV